MNVLEVKGDLSLIEGDHGLMVLHGPSVDLEAALDDDAKAAGFYDHLSSAAMSGKLYRGSATLTLSSNDWRVVQEWDANASDAEIADEDA